ncbi:helix-turn-helix domain-containing protein [Nonomuraea rhodomycinica]|uniref:Helix-turn-helix domain-containing protein n=1 Tax=Nonomuraea rhodomycinica TaxID=1712872 RepID=A0A7Y6IWZ5_9ACTN|nr:helix-turn-helix domain-containing protein [Nonomuraea rhodomycinica]NUW45880.1 helix-turn-helix domain-containing protein [Nonomuraea rhodomycinica]
MGLEVESRPSDSPYVERVWRSTSHDVSRMTSIAAAHLDLVFWQHRGKVSAAVMGPETKAGHAPVPEGATFFGILFSLGTSMPHLPTSRLVDGSAEIPDVTPRSFWLKGSSWRLPDYENAETFVRRMVREGIVERDPVVAAALHGAPPDVSERTLQRRFVAATGLTRGAVRQIDRARRAAVLIREGVPIQDVVHRLGYFDQPHLARSLTRYIGRTATRLTDLDAAEPLSLLYKT